MINVTKHAQERMIERGISPVDIVHTLKDGDKSKSIRQPGCYLAIGTAITVVYSIMATSVDILTVYSS